jgi:hypothetical protein
MRLPQDYPPAYIAFCDEAGDPGLKEKASEWFIVSAVVVRADRAGVELVRWLERIRRPMRGRQRPDLHFYLLKPWMKERASRFLGKLPVRCFAVISHKQNMIGHRNERVEARYAWRDYAPDGQTWTVKPRTNWFHNWMLKVLLERVTAYCEARSLREYGEPRLVDIKIAERGGFSIGDFKSALEIDRRDWHAGTGTLESYLAWPVVDLKYVQSAPAAQVPGMQLADIVSGSFLHAVDLKRLGECNTNYATNLTRRMAMNGQDVVRDFGVMAWPRPLKKVALHPEQLAIFKHFGYADEWLVGPGPVSAGLQRKRPWGVPALGMTGSELLTPTMSR